MKELTFLTIVLVITLQNCAVDGFVLRSGKAKPTNQSCTFEQDCPHGYCCTGLNTSNSTGVCQKYLKIGQLCKKTILHGGSLCPCARGSTCTLDMFDKNGYAINRCEPVYYYDDDLHERLGRKNEN